MRVSKAEVDAYLRRTMGKSRLEDKAWTDTTDVRSAAGPATKDDRPKDNGIVICGQDVSLDILVSHSQLDIRDHPHLPFPSGKL
jgi:hypothetical protein